LEYNSREKVKLKMGFARARIEKLIRTAGAHRVSAGAIDRLNEILTDYSTTVAKYAVEIAQHSGRKTVKESDIKLAATK
ncbi:MAG: histone family protein, partial [Candidatus Thorarchaeota archaeon]